MPYHNYYIYITTNPTKTVLYVGVTNNLAERITTHFTNKGNPNTFAGKFYCYNLVYYEHYLNIEQAIAREKELKDWRRDKKMALITSFNPEWRFLNSEVLER